MERFLFLSILICSVASVLAATKCDGKVKTNKYAGEWFCETNTFDNAINVTYDCLNNRQTERFWIWSPMAPGLPTRTKILTIQNCQELFLDIDFRFNYLPTFRYLNLVNITDLTLDYTFGRRCLPSSVTFTNVTVNDLRARLIDDIQVCEGNGTALKSFILKKVSIDTLPTSFLHSSTLINFELDEVKINSIEANAINIENLTSTIKISNSNFEKLEKIFITGKVYDVIIDNTTIQTLKVDPSNYNSGFSLEAKSVIVNGRKLHDLCKDKYKCTAQVIAQGMEAILNGSQEFEGKILKKLDQLINQNTNISNGSKDFYDDLLNNLTREGNRWETFLNLISEKFYNDSLTSQINQKMENKKWESILGLINETLHNGYLTSENEKDEKRTSYSNLNQISSYSLLMIACLITGFAAYILINKCYKFFKTSSFIQRQKFVSEETEMERSFAN